MQALGPKVVTGLGPCRDWVLLKDRDEHTLKVAAKSRHTERVDSAAHMHPQKPKKRVKQVVNSSFVLSHCHG